MTSQKCLENYLLVLKKKVEKSLRCKDPNLAFIQGHVGDSAVDWKKVV